jgi:hypothetical protein
MFNYLFFKIFAIQQTTKDTKEYKNKREKKQIKKQTFFKCLPQNFPKELLPKTSLIKKADTKLEEIRKTTKNG